VDLRQFKKAKRFWSDEKASNAWSFYCPHCTTARKIPCQPRPTAQHFAQIALTAVFFTVLTWSWFSWKGLVSFIPLWTVFEAIYRGRVRVAMQCPHCGFDPFLYAVDIQRARQEIETHWRKKFADKGIPFPEKPVDPEPMRPASQGVLLASSVKSGKSKTRPVQRPDKRQ
jgi:predicted RNA-binding Zn-ribbon protein involved in translation (DUF1610 family)